MRPTKLGHCESPFNNLCNEFGHVSLQQSWNYNKQQWKWVTPARVNPHPQKRYRAHIHVISIDHVMFHNNRWRNVGIVKGNKIWMKKNKNTDKYNMFPIQRREDITSKKIIIKKSRNVQPYTAPWFGICKETMYTKDSSSVEFWSCWLGVWRRVTAW